MANLIDLALNLFLLGLIGHLVCPLIAHPQAKNIANWLEQWYEPLLKPVRSKLPPANVGGKSIDLAPILLFFGILLLRSLFV
tara:strand:- start:180 stop:425 length:246 start_codon:yes stop_codon:yes gene_type:complete